LFTLIIRSRNHTVLCGLKLLFGSIVLVDSAETGYYFILFCFVDKVVEALFKFFGTYLCGLDVGYPDAFVCIGELLIVIPYGWICLQLVEDVIGEDKGFRQYISYFVH
jgi:hypothetical protein